MKSSDFGSFFPKVNDFIFILDRARKARFGGLYCPPVIPAEIALGRSGDFPNE